MVDKTILASWGENTAYSAKGHFKTADIKSFYLKGLIIVNILFAIFSIMELNLPLLVKLFGLISLIASILLLVEENSKNKSSSHHHMKIGDEYLALHYKLQNLHSQEKPAIEEFKELEKRLKR